MEAVDKETPTGWTPILENEHVVISANMKEVNGVRVQRDEQVLISAKMKEVNGVQVLRIAVKDHHGGWYEIGFHRGAVVALVGPCSTPAEAKREWRDVVEERSRRHERGW